MYLKSLPKLPILLREGNTLVLPALALLQLVPPQPEQLVLALQLLQMLVGCPLALAALPCSTVAGHPSY
jgi:hypothetical protein